MDLLGYSSGSSRRARPVSSRDNGNTEVIRERGLAIPPSAPPLSFIVFILWVFLRGQHRPLQQSKQANKRFAGSKEASNFLRLQNHSKHGTERVGYGSSFLRLRLRDYGNTDMTSRRRRVRKYTSIITPRACCRPTRQVRRRRG